MHHHFDHLIIGGGCAGLSLAYHLHQHPDLRQRRTLILEEAPEATPPKTWCFWDEQPAPYRCARRTAWEYLAFCDAHAEVRHPLRPLQYYHVDSRDFYDEIGAALATNPHVVRRVARAEQLTQTNHHVAVRAGADVFTADWVFNTSLALADTPLPDQPTLKQHFLGWVVRTERPCFETSTVRLMDFRTPAAPHVQFVYVLPFSAHEALVEFTIFSDTLATRAAYEAGLSHYLRDVVGTEHYEVVHTEQGVIPMSNHVFAERTGQRIVHLGTAGGATKPTTGYTFLNIQRDVRQRVAALATTGQPFYPRPSGGRFRFYDHLLLYLIRHHSEQIPGIFARLFRDNDARRVLRFLDERTHLWEDARIFLTLPWSPFLQALWKCYLRPPAMRSPAPSASTACAG